MLQVLVAQGRLDLRGGDRQVGIRPEPGSDLIAKTGLVAAGLGVAIVPELLLPSLRADLAIVRLRRPVHRGVYLLSRTDRSGLDGLVAVLTFLGG